MEMVIAAFEAMAHGSRLTLPPEGRKPGGLFPGGTNDCVSDSLGHRQQKQVSQISKATGVDNLEVSATNFTCTVDAVLTMYECGTSSSCCEPDDDRQRTP
jgi:hypothetical protein